VHTLAEAGRPPLGADLDVSSAVPIGAGLSSSAAFEVAVALALAEVAGFAAGGRELMRAAQQAEHVATGVPCGVQDQMASVFGVADHALLIDCRSLEIVSFPLPTSVRVLVVHSGVERTLERTPYAQRRAESLAVAERLGVAGLRDATLEQVRDEPRGRHAVTEMQRVLAFRDAMVVGDVEQAGALMLASHASSRDDMQVSTPDLDTLVEELVTAGAYGARLTGAGFGGCVVALVPRDGAEAIAADATEAYRRQRGREPTAWFVRAAGGAGPAPPKGSEPER
jgi:galactokinase